MGSSNSNVHITSPDAYIAVFPYTQEETEVGTPYSPSATKTKAYFFGKDILSISTNKGKGAVGTWQVSLASSQNYKAHIHPGCWIMIYMDDQGFNTYKDGSSEKSGLKMVGIVRSVRCIESLQGDGRRSIRYELGGDDFQSLLNTEIYIHSPFMSASGASNPQLRNWVIHPDFIDGTSPTKLIQGVIKTYLEKAPESAINVEHEKTAGGTIILPSEVAKRLGGGTKFGDALQKKISELPGSFVTMSSPGDQFTLWSLMKQLSNPSFNEIFTDLMVEGGSLKPTLVLREIPFSIKKPHGGLSVKDIPISKKIAEHEILQLNYGKSDAERFNMFLISPSHNPGGKSWVIDRLGPKGKPQELFDGSSVARFGLRPFITISDYTNNTTAEIKRMNEIARDMWSKAHLFENGQVTIVGSHQYIPVGSNIEFTERKWIAHVEAVSHQYHVSHDGEKGFFTTISFVRLQTKDGKPIDMVEKGKRDVDPGATHSEGGEA